MGILTGLRPWSWTAGTVPVLITAKLQGKLLTTDALRLLIMTIGAQSAGNAINSYYDYMKKIDTKEEAGDGSVVDGHLSEKLCLPVAAGCILGSALASLKFFGNAMFSKLFLLGTGLSVFYTAPPFCLKYYALGDIVILATFGPVLMQACSVALTGAVDNSVNAYSVPITILTEAILWANNARDIKADRRAGVTTVCGALGFDKSKRLYQLMVAFSYAACVLLGLQRRKPGLFLPLLTLPIAVTTLRQFTEDDFKVDANGNIPEGAVPSMKEAPDRTAQLHLPFGLLMLLGLALDEKFFVNGSK